MLNAYLKTAICLTTFFLTAFLVLFSKDAISAPSKKNKAQIGTNHALIIGISDYNKWADLKSPAKDAKAIYKILSTRYNFKRSNIILLTDYTKEKPTLSNILNYLDKYTTELKVTDNLLIFFSGHSSEDEKGETYWIPQDGKKNSKMTWLKHSDLCLNFFAADNFKAKSLCIITDSVFSSKLIRSGAISLTPYDLRYPEKIKEKSTRHSREVLSFGDQHWPGSSKTDGLGLFTYYICKALQDNQLDIIDFENLVFDEEILFSITRIAGTRMMRGRLKTPLEKGGQFVITKTKRVPKINVLTADISPKKGYPGSSFLFTATTAAPATEVFIEINGTKHPMKGSGKKWKLNKRVETLGKNRFKAIAANSNGTLGKSKSGSLTIIKQQAAFADVKTISVDPKKGLAGDTVKFSATTSSPAAEVIVTIDGKPFKMAGAGTDWHLDEAVMAFGKIKCTIIATNSDGIQGKQKSDTLVLAVGPSNVVDVKTDPETVYAGEEFIITALTDRPAKSVTILLDGRKYTMKGSGTKWISKRTIKTIGEKNYTISAKNPKGVKGSPQSGIITTKKSPLPIPNTLSADASPATPGKNFAGDRFKVKVKTSAPADIVYIKIDDETQKMTGSGTRWEYTTKIDIAGATPFSVFALNKDGARGSSKEGKIIAAKPPALPVSIVTANVNPKKGNRGRAFTFKAKTDMPATEVALMIEGKRYDMKGTGTSWSYVSRIDKIGTIEFSMVAKNEDMVEGGIKTASLEVIKRRYKNNKDGTVTDLITGKIRDRFLDHGDGTITDLATNLMRPKKPKQIAVTYEEATEYCRDLEIKGHTGWRLPTLTEWKRFVDKSNQNPSLPNGHPFSSVLTHVDYWTKSKHKFGSQYVYKISLWTGKEGYLNKKKDSIVWPVRYAELEE